jgi:hypothetical protein
VSSQNGDSETPFSASECTVYEKIEVDVLPVPPFWLAIEITIGRQLNQKPVAGFLASSSTN